MKVLQLNYSDINGGAARAAYRIHHALRSTGIDSQMLVNVAASGDWTVQGPTSKWAKAIGRLLPQLATPLYVVTESHSRDLMLAWLIAYYRYFQDQVVLALVNFPE